MTNGMGQRVVLRTPAWGKLLIVAVGLVLEIAAFIGFTSSSSNQDSRYIASVTSISITFFVVFMFPIIWKTLSTELSDSGIQQIAFFSAGRACGTRQLKWTEISRATFSPARGIYRLEGPSFSVVIGVNFFSSSTKAIKFVHEHLPKNVQVTMV